MECPRPPRPRGSGSNAAGAGRRRLLAAALLTGLAASAEAALFIVDTRARDAEDMAPGDGVCAYSNLPPAGSRCTLRAAVQEANALAGADVILIPDGWTIVLDYFFYGIEDQARSGDLDILESVSIGSLVESGQWPTVDGGGIDRVFDVHAPAVLTLGQIQIAGGRTIGASQGGEAGGVWVRTGAGGDFFNCRFFGNQGTDGAITNDGDTTVTDCTIEDNLGNNGANTAAVANTWHLEVVRSAVVRNRSIKAGIFNASGGLLTVRNSTIHDNTGFGIRSQDDLVLLNVTITGHAQGTGLSHNQPGAFFSPQIRNSIIAGNVLDCSITIPGGAADTAYPNLDSDGSCGFLPAAGGLPATDPVLHVLGPNGGSTPSRVPDRTSPVIEAGDNGTCEADDQRGASRPLDGDGVAGATCDLGAVEVLPCTGLADRIVNSSVFSITVELSACFTITVGPAVEVRSTGRVTFRTRDVVALGNGVSVDAGGQLTVILDPATLSGIVLP